MNFGFVRGTTRYQYILAVCILLIVISSSGIAFANVNQQECKSKCAYEYQASDGACITKAPAHNTYDGRNIYNMQYSGYDCSPMFQEGSYYYAECYCINPDSSYLGANNLAMAGVLDTSCKYTGEGNTGYYLAVVTYFSFGMSSFTVEDNSRIVKSILAGIQYDVRKLPRAQVEAGKTGPDYDVSLKWRPPSSISDYLYQGYGGQINRYTSSLNQYQDIPLICEGPQTGGGIEIQALDGAKEIGIKNVRCGGQELPNKWNLVDLDQSTGESVSGTCDLTFDKQYNIYGVMIAAQPGMVVSNIAAGSIVKQVNQSVPASGKIFLNLPLDKKGVGPKSSSFRVVFSGSGTVYEINPFPDVALLDLLVSPKIVTIGDSVAIEGNVTKRIFEAQGQYAVCKAGFQSKCKVTDESDLYVIPLPATLFNTLKNAGIGFPLFTIQVSPNNYLQLGLIAAGLVLMTKFTGNEFKDKKSDFLKAAVIVGLLWYAVQDAQKQEGECKEITTNGKTDKKCKLRIAFIPWFSYKVNPDPGPASYQFDYDTCVRPSSTDILLMNLPTYLAFGQYWKDTENTYIDKKDSQTETRVDEAVKAISTCESCTDKGIVSDDFLYCNGLTSDQCNKDSKCTWNDNGYCSSKSVRKVWCSNKIMIGDETYFYKEKVEGQSGCYENTDCGFDAFISAEQCKDPDMKTAREIEQLTKDDTCKNIFIEAEGPADFTLCRQSDCKVCRSKEESSASKQIICRSTCPEEFEEMYEGERDSGTVHVRVLDKKTAFLNDVAVELSGCINPSQTSKTNTQGKAFFENIPFEKRCDIKVTYHDVASEYEFTFTRQATGTDVTIDTISESQGFNVVTKSGLADADFDVIYAKGADENDLDKILVNKKTLFLDGYITHDKDIDSTTTTENVQNDFTLSSIVQDRMSDINFESSTPTPKTGTASSSSTTSNNMAQDLAKVFERQASIKKAAGQGAAYYYRTWKTKPGLKPDCGQYDPVLGSGYGRAGISTGTSSSSITGAATSERLAGTISPPIEIGVESGPYHTEEGEIFKFATTVYITIINSTNETAMDCIADNVSDQLCKDIPVPTNENGYYKYFYIPRVNGTYTAVVKVHSNNGTVNDTETGLVTERSDTFEAKNFEQPKIIIKQNESCSLPIADSDFDPSLVDMASFPIIIENARNISLLSVLYYIQIIEEPGSEFGDAGFKEVDENGQMFLANNKTVRLGPGERIIVNVSSAMILPIYDVSKQYQIRVSVSNETYNVSKEFLFTHNVFKKTPAILNLITEPVKRPFDLRPETYFIRITNPNPEKCGFNDYILLKEVPNLWSGTIEIDGEISTIRLNASQSVEAMFTLSPNAQAVQIGKRYEANMIVTEKLPDDIQSLKGASDFVGIDVDDRSIFLIGKNRITFVNKTNMTVVSYEAKGGKAIATDQGAGGNIYWSESSQGDSKILCSSKIRFSSNRMVNNVDATSIAVTDNYIYFVQADGIYRALKNCQSEQISEKIYSIDNAKEIADISSANNVIYWIEKNLVNGTSFIKSVGESQITTSGATDIFTLASRDASLLYISKGSGRIGEAGRFGVYYATNATTARIARFGADRAYIIIGGATTEPVVSKPLDMAVDNSTVYWIQSGVKKISKNNLANYISMFYEYTPDPPFIVITPANVSASPGEQKRFAVNITNKAFVNVRYSIFLENVDSFSPPWMRSLAGTSGLIEETFGPRETKSYEMLLTPNETLSGNKSFKVCVRAINTTIWSDSVNGSAFSRCAGISIGTRSPPSVTLTLIDAKEIVNGKAKTLPGESVWYDVSVRNNDVQEFGIGAFRLSAELPNNWKAVFEKDLLNITPGSTATTRMKIDVSAGAYDGEYEIKVTAMNVMDQRAKASAFARIIINICGNGICDLERGEDNARCSIDCPNPPYTNFAGVYNVPNWPALLQHDYNTTTGVNFSAILTFGLDRSLEQQKFLICRRFSSTDECRQAFESSNCGLGKSCLGGKILSQSEINPLVNMRCPDDSSEAYYILYTGRKIVNLNPVYIDFKSPNYTYTCPFYNMSGLRNIKSSIEEKSLLCQQILFNYNNSIYSPPPGKTREDCTDAWKKICDLENNFLKYLNLVTDPAIMSLDRVQYAFELYSRMKNEIWFTDYHQCEGVVTLFIEDVRIRR